MRNFVMKVQRLLNLMGVSPRLTEDGDPGPKTMAALDAQIAKLSPKVEPKPPSAPGKLNPGYTKAKEFSGKTEFDSTFNKYLSGFWALVGLPSYKTIIGTSFAWCGLFISAMQTETGLSIAKSAAGARNWANYGQAIEWRTNGIPRSAILHLNHSGNCSSGSGNHVTYADGDCSPADVNKAGATVPGFGGNQGNTVKRSIYSIKEVCAVRWPPEMALPAKVEKSVDCGESKSGSESTR